MTNKDKLLLLLDEVRDQCNAGKTTWSSLVVNDLVDMLDRLIDFNKLEEEYVEKV